MIRRILFVIGFCFVLISCQTAPNRAAPKENVEIRDVEVNARNDDEGLRHRILVLPFLDEKADRPKKVAEAARQVLVREILKTHQFVIVAMEDFPQDPKKFLTTDQEYDLAAISRIAAGMGIAAVVEGKILEVHAKRAGDTVGLIRHLRAQVETQTRLRVFAGKNGKEILNEVRTASEEVSSTHMGEIPSGSLADDPELVQQSVRKGFVGGLPNLVKAIEKLGWEGRVAAVAGEKIYINAGRLSGLQVGDILKVTEDGDDVYDPQTGRFIGTAPGRMKGTIEIVSYFGKDGCITVIHSGSGFQENDRVELY